MNTSPRPHSPRRTRALGPAAILVLAALAACGGGANGDRAEVQPDASGPRGSSTIVLTADDKRLLVVNPDADTLSIFDVVQQQPVMSRELGVGSDPRSVAVTFAGDKAYVANAGSNSVSVIKLGTPPQVIGTIAVGTEPRAVVIARGHARR